MKKALIVSGIIAVVAAVAGVVYAVISDNALLDYIDNEE